MLKRFGIFVLLTMYVFLLRSQVCDSFTDGDFLDNPSWLGLTESFQVNDDKLLQLNAPEGGDASIYLPISFESDAQWEFFFRLDFAPSTSNLLRIYLLAKDENILNGDAYYLEVGASGSEDPIRFFRQSSGSSTLLAESAPGIVATEPVVVRMKVTKVGELWTFFLNLNGGEPAFHFNAQDAEIDILGVGNFGFYCKFSETRKDRFFFDDICIGPFEPDVLPPIWSGLNVKNATTLELLFDEALASDAESKENYTVIPGNLIPASVALVGNFLELTFAEPFDSNTEYILGISEVADTVGNKAFDLEMSFKYTEIFQAARFDLLINEIMADPNPIVSLPNAEYLEIFHNGLMTFDLGDYKMKVGSKIVDLPTKIISPEDYLILCDLDDAIFFESFGTVIGISGMPTLTNSGTSIQLIDGFNQVIHEVDYTDKWYQDAAKDDGGWSLELINPLKVCSGETNWRASIDLQGGTPGSMNSVIETEPDLDGPQLLDIIPFESNRLLLRFDEALWDDVLDLEKFQLEPFLPLGGGFINNINELVLTFNAPFEASVVYTLNVALLQDCQGNEERDQTASFGIPEPIEKGDLIIHEILFNPGTGGSRFIELLNVSNKILNTNQIVIGEITVFGVNLNSVVTEKLIFPGDIIAFSPNPQDIKSRYTVPKPNQLVNAILPSWDDETGNATILSNGVIIDSFSYHRDWHNPAIDDENGVSLERVSPNASSTDKNAWHSAAASAGFATPTGLNSQTISLIPLEKPFTFVSSTFSPDQDGYQDFLSIAFQTTLLDGTVSINIYDGVGRLVRKLVRNQTIGSNTLIQWDGTNGDGEVQRIGTYIVTLELFNPEGEVQSFKEVCVLAQKL